MKINLFLILMIVSNILGYGQSVSLKSSTGITDNHLFITPTAVGIGFSYGFKKSELNTELQYSKFKTNTIREFDFHPLNEQYLALCATYAKTKAFSLCLSQLFYLKKNDFASISIGPNFGLSLFNGIIKKHYDSTNGLDDVRYEYSFKNKIYPSLGLIFKTEIYKVITEKMSLLLSINPQFYFHKRIMEGEVHIGPPSILLTSFGIGLKYHFN